MEIKVLQDILGANEQIADAQLIERFEKPALTRLEGGVGHARGLAAVADWAFGARSGGRGIRHQHPAAGGV